MPKPQTYALIVSAGVGARLGKEMPKQYLPLGGIAVLRHSVETFLHHPAIDGVCVVINPRYRELYEQAVDGLALLPAITGGDTRQASVKAGLKALSELPTPPQHVLIHDAARPFVSPTMIDRLLEALEAAPAAIPGLRPADTVKSHQGGYVETTLNRDALVQVQTPQAFHLPVILQAHLQAPDSLAPDDAALAESAGIPVKLVKGEEKDFKITTQDDLLHAQCYTEPAMNQSYEYRSGQGFDVHAFTKSPPADGHILLCGVPVAHSHGIDAHSDGDVGLHALVDALLGTIGGGDIGQHFPPTDPKWKNADSSAFICHAMQLVQKAGGSIVNVDVTLIGERPKIGSYRQAMQAHVANLLAIEPARVNIKATTTEKLGFTGRKEGLAAMAVASVRFLC